jgi:hypothetical protein
MLSGTLAITSRYSFLQAGYFEDCQLRHRHIMCHLFPEQTVLVSQWPELPEEHVDHILKHSTFYRFVISTQYTLL